MLICLKEGSASCATRILARAKPTSRQRRSEIYKSSVAKDEGEGRSKDGMFIIIENVK
jgi:hypothetical protein